MAASPMVYTFASLTDTGRARTNNEDAVACEPALGLAVLADGMGGYNAGEVASAMASGAIATALGTWLLAHQHKASPRETAIAMRLSVERANRDVYQASLDHNEFAGMGTTVVVAVFLGHRMVVGHVGDSRCYRWRDQSLQPLTRDHSLLQEQIDAGLLSPSAAQHAPYRNLVTRALGVEPSVQLDVSEHTVKPHDWYLLCSDGLTDMLDHVAIGQLLKSSTSPQTAAQMLVDAANAAGGRDNISVIVVHAEGPPPKQGLLSRWRTP